MLEKRYVRQPNTFAYIVIISLAAVLLRLVFLDYASPDYNNFLLPWMNEFREGGFLALKTTSSNYNVPYLYILALFSYLPVKDLYLIKLLSIVFDFVLAFTMMGLVKDDSQSFSYKPLIAFAVVLLWPLFWLNSGYWGQCDSIYAAFCLLSYSSAIKNKPLRSMLFAGLAFTFKLQAVFFLPFFGVLLIARKMKLWHAAVFPIPYLLLSVPVLLMGWPISRIIGVYTEQVDIYSSYLSLNAPSVFAFFVHSPKYPYFYAGIAATALYMLFLLVTAFFRRKELHNTRLLSAFAFAMCVGVVWLLPSMHERYFYLAEVFVILFAVLNPKRWYAAVLVMFGSLTGYHAYLVRGILADDLWLGSIVMLAAVACAVAGCFMKERVVKQ